MPRIIDIQRRYMELGRIRMGDKSERGNPQRLESWRLTSASRSLLDAAAELYGGEVQEWTDAPDAGYFELYTETASLDVMLPPGDPYSQYYELWSGGGCKRRCDGVTELLSAEPCKCDPDSRQCKITTRISVMLPRVPGLGVWRLESHGYYAAAELPDQLDLLQTIGGGRMIAGQLRIEQRSAKRDGKTQRYPVPVLDLPGITLAALTEGQVVVNPPAVLEPGKPALLTGTVLPGDPDFDNGTPDLGPKPELPVLDEPGQGAQAMPDTEPSETPPVPAPADLRGELARVAAEKHLGIDAIESYATLIGIEKGERATDEQMRLLLNAITTHGTTAELVLPITQGADGGEAESPPAVGSSSAPAEPPPPRPGSPEYDGLSSDRKRAQATRYWMDQEVKA